MTDASKLLSKEDLDEAFFTLDGDASYGSDVWEATHAIRAHISALESRPTLSDDLEGLVGRLEARAPYYTEWAADIRRLNGTSVDADHADATAKDLREAASAIRALAGERDGLADERTRVIALWDTWDIEAVGRLIGCDVGQSILPEIQPALEKAYAELRALKREVAEAIEPFARAAAAVEKYSPDFPDDAACLRASFDWYASADGVEDVGEAEQLEYIRERSVRTKHLRRLASLSKKLSKTDQRDGDA